jgi:Tfp pilus assembly protein PilX
MQEKSLLKNEDGSIIVLAMIMLVLLTLLGISATTTSSIEVQIAANENQALQNLYQAESGNHYALELTGTADTWMTDTFLAAADTAAYAKEDNVDIDSDGTPDVNIEIRCIENSGADISELTPAANNLPAQQHISSPPVGSGYSLNDFEIRRYGITATSVNGNTKVQIGAYKVFNRY